MSRWIYLEPDLPPTVSEGPQREKRKRRGVIQEPERVGGHLVSRRLTPQPLQIFLLQWPLPSHQGWEEPSRAFQSHRQICSQAHLGTRGQASSPFNHKKEVHQSF